MKYLIYFKPKYTRNNCLLALGNNRALVGTFFISSALDLCGEIFLQRYKNTLEIRSGQEGCVRI